MAFRHTTYVRGDITVSAASGEIGEIVQVIGNGEVSLKDLGISAKLSAKGCTWDTTRRKWTIPQGTDLSDLSNKEYAALTEVQHRDAFLVE